MRCSGTPTTDGYLSLRSFYDDVSEVFRIRGVPMSSSQSQMVNEIQAMATGCANAERPAVFCPPLATFSVPDKADEASLANGLVLSVECDQQPAQARLKLESLLGPATVIVRSGGEWLDRSSGELQDKLHLHWRLNEPTRCNADHLRLKAARTLATALVGGDTSNQPAVHPIRWPGSWHRKALPKLARIAALTEAEIGLDDALERLQEAVAAAGCNTSSEMPKGSKPRRQWRGTGHRRANPQRAHRSRLPRRADCPRDAVSAGRNA